MARASVARHPGSPQIEPIGAWLGFSGLEEHRDDDVEKAIAIHVGHTHAGGLVG